MRVECAAGFTAWFGGGLWTAVDRTTTDSGVPRDKLYQLQIIMCGNTAGHNAVLRC